MKPLEELDDYVSGAMAESDAGDFEERLFASAARADKDAAPLTVLDRLQRSLRELVERGSFEITLTVAEAEALVKRSKLQIKIFDAILDTKLDAMAELAKVDLAMFSFPVDLTDVTRVDLELGHGQQTVITLPDVRVDRDANRVVLCCEGDLARAAFRPGSFTRVVAVEGKERRTLGEFAYRP